MQVRIVGGQELSERWYLIKDLVEKSLVHGTGDLSAYDIFIECLQAISSCVRCRRK